MGEGLKPTPEEMGQGGQEMTEAQYESELQDEKKREEKESDLGRNLEQMRRDQYSGTWQDHEQNR